ncbi:unnamed protein product [Bursaphelenchus okinawaensis]|uniref:Trehalase n=1 Tax=Bursaphelenchus okinawaensis TaxID=465554 RepID=A0A811LEA9_9BILA|nr:unnamed protein product [Bursaphelenchus okinawaensis]CAG9121451.1 unnamed protein product [Bursaphelenchus okinawaensis]
MVIEGLRKSNDPIMQDKGFEIATKWIQGNFKVYNKTKDMFEKYNVGGDVPEPGHGGEYKVQTGFGWSNGVVLDLLHTYYDRIEVPVTETKSANEMNVVIPALTLINLFYQLV